MLQSWSISWIFAALRHKFEIMESPVFEHCCASSFEYCQYFGVNVLTRKWLKGKKGFQKFHSQFKLSLESETWVFKLPACCHLFCFVKALVSSTSCEHKSNTSQLSSSSCKLLWQFCPADAQRLSPKHVRIGLVQCQARGGLNADQRIVLPPLAHEGSGKGAYLDFSRGFHRFLQPQTRFLPPTQAQQGTARILQGWHPPQPRQLHLAACQRLRCPTPLLRKAITLLISAKTSWKGGRCGMGGHWGDSAGAAVLPVVTRRWGWNEEKPGDKRGQEGNILLTEKKYAWD